jgi:hypothetical protein
MLLRQLPTAQQQQLAALPRAVPGCLQQQLAPLLKLTRTVLQLSHLQRSLSHRRRWPRLLKRAWCQRHHPQQPPHQLQRLRCQSA